MDTKNMTKAELEAALNQVKAENKALIDSQGGLKVSEKQALSCYGLGGRFPVTLYAEQWEALFVRIPEIKAFIAEHPELKRRAVAANVKVG